MTRLTFITGGARSGKSRYAEELAAASGAPVIYLATMEPGDDELVARVARHRERRPPDWRTVEEPLRVAEALSLLAPSSVVLLDCLSLWVSNQLFASIAEPAVATPDDWEDFIERCVAEADRVVAECLDRELRLIAVSNEVGLGIVPESPLGRWYRDALGLVNQRFAVAADEAVLLVSGLPLRLR